MGTEAKLQYSNKRKYTRISMDEESLEIQCRIWLETQLHEDAAHDMAHIKRVVKNARSILEEETADRSVVIAAAWLHDCVNLPKNNPERQNASTLAAGKAVEFLKDTSFPAQKLPLVAHAIEAHSFSANISAETPEAKIVQDADRLDALGAVGIARCFSVGGALDSPVYNASDPFCASREPDDSRWTLDHFYTKLFRLPGKMNTPAARTIAEKRAAYMTGFLKQLATEIA